MVFDLHLTFPQRHTMSFVMNYKLEILFCFQGLQVLEQLLKSLMELFFHMLDWLVYAQYMFNCVNYNI